MAIFSRKMPPPDEPNTPPSNVEIAQAYHDRTKHHVYRYARSAGYLDWDTQPDPFRRFDGTPQTRLPFTPDPGVPFEAIYAPATVPPREITFDTIAAFFENSLAISAWKEYRGARWALRCNPSSGNLHPTEGYLVAGPITGLSDRPGVYHYCPEDHCIEQRCAFDDVRWQRLVAAFPPHTFFAALTSIHWREAWKYGERAYRYCQHDVGHAIAAYAFSAAIQGWQALHLDGVGDATLAALLGVDRDADFPVVQEREQADCIFAIVPANTTASVPRSLPVESVQEIAAGTWQGQANRLSSDHMEWDVIDTVAQACVKPDRAISPAPKRSRSSQDAETGVSPCGHSAVQIIRQRRSAVAMDGRSGLDCSRFYGMLSRVVPGPQKMPWTVLGEPACVHLALFVHRVKGLKPGLYMLLRNDAAIEPLRAATNPAFLWQRPPGCPEALSLYLLHPGDCTNTATLVSCQQDIAGMSAFSLGMLAEFETSLRDNDAWFYRRLFWETGMIGQALYLEAEAAGLRATGIGCFFDDAMHEVLGMTDRRYQSLYHFTVGGPVEDTRLTTLPPYSRARGYPILHHD